MDTHLDLDELTRKTRRLEYEDGLQDLVNAVVFLIVGSLVASIYSTSTVLWYVRTVSKHPALIVVGLLILTPSIALLLFLSRRWIDHLRRNRLWKDSGFVKPLSGYIDWRINAIAALILVVLTFVGMWGTLHGWLAPGTDLRTLVSSLGIATGIVYFGMGKTLRFPRYVLVGIAGGLLSITMVLLPTSFATSWILLGVTWALVLVISGLAGLRAAQRATEEATDA